MFDKLPEPLKNVFKAVSCWNAERKHQKNMTRLQQMVKEESDCRQRVSEFDNIYNN